MSQQYNQTIISFKADDSLSAYRVVKLSAANEVNYWATSETALIGVTVDSAAKSDAAVPVCVAGTCKVEIGDSITAGVLVGPLTAGSGVIVSRDSLKATTTSLVPILGIALTSASLTGSYIEVLLQPFNCRQA